MMNIAVPSFWHLDPLNINKKTPSELENVYWKNSNVVYLKLNILEDKHSNQGIKPNATKVPKIAELFSKLGDINVVKCAPDACYLELQHVDKSALKPKLKSPALDLIALIKKELSAEQKGGNNKLKKNQS
jgi:hypothetical protein